jgi:hypothetical protein
MATSLIDHYRDLLPVDSPYSLLLTIRHLESIIEDTNWVRLWFLTATNSNLQQMIQNILKVRILIAMKLYIKYRILNLIIFQKRYIFLQQNQLDALISQIYFGKKLYMFRTGWNSVPSWSCSQAVHKTVWHIQLLCVQWKTPDDGQRNCPILLASCLQNCMTYTIAVCTVKTPDDGQRNCPKHVQFHSKE